MYFTKSCKTLKYLYICIVLVINILLHCFSYIYIHLLKISTMLYQKHFQMWTYNTTLANVKSCRKAAGVPHSWDLLQDRHVFAIQYYKQQLGTSQSTAACNHVRAQSAGEGLKELFWWRQRETSKLVRPVLECTPVKLSTVPNLILVYITGFRRHEPASQNDTYCRLMPNFILFSRAAEMHMLLFCFWTYCSCVQRVENWVKHIRLHLMS